MFLFFRARCEHIVAFADLLVCWADQATATPKMSRSVFACHFALALTLNFLGRGVQGWLLLERGEFVLLCHREQSCLLCRATAEKVGMLVARIIVHKFLKLFLLIFRDICLPLGRGLLVCLPKDLLPDTELTFFVGVGRQGCLLLPVSQRWHHQWVHEERCSHGGVDTRPLLRPIRHVIA